MMDFTVMGSPHESGDAGSPVTVLAFPSGAWELTVDCDDDDRVTIIDAGWTRSPPVGPDDSIEVVATSDSCQFGQLRTTVPIPTVGDLTSTWIDLGEGHQLRVRRSPLDSIVVPHR